MQNMHKVGLARSGAADNETICRVLVVLEKTIQGSVVISQSYFNDDEMHCFIKRRDA